ncbi:MAG TPA: enterochelin esterase [Bryobacteraceae bacterium]|nr:enterochelin esterase [Bryobacteraceae bacterium]
MRSAAILVATLAITCNLYAADALVGDWKLNLAKSSWSDGRAVKNGRALIEPDNSGGYLQFSETVFAEGPALRFASHVQFNGTPDDGSFEDRPVRSVSTRTDASGFDISVRDPNTEQTTRRIRVTVSPQDHELTMTWTDGGSSPVRKLVYEEAPPGTVLEVSKTVEHAFGPAETFAYLINLKAGEYCQGTVDQKDGGINIGTYGPDGARIRNIGGPPTGKKTFAFEAPVAGTYRIALRSPVKPAASYTITLDKVVGLNERLRMEPSKEKLTSARIDALRKAVEGGDHGAVTTFWQDVEKQGTPLIEPMKDDNANNLVTFLWRARSETRNVLILWFPYVFARPDDFKMMHLANTDVWYRTMKIRRGARFAYQLSPNDPLTFDDSATSRMVTAQADPLNPHHWFDGPGSTRFEYQSMVEMPDAKPQPYIAKREGLPHGKVERSRIKSALLDNERNLSIYLPPGYRREGTPNGLLVVFDEGSYITLVPTPTILDNLIAEKKIPPMVAVLIANPDQETRTRELPPNPKFADFLNNELVPWVRENYNVTKDPSQVVVAGSSFGGIASVYAGLRHPETFGNILCQSGSFWWSAPKPEPYAEPNYLAKEFLKSPKLPLRFYMDAGTFEVDVSGGGGAILEPSRHMRDVLLAKGYEVHYQENVGGHDYLSWRGSLAEGLLALVGTSK